MVVAIHQPNFIPWLGYFYKIKQSDVFVIIDQVQFTKGSICNRNKIKGSSGDEILLTVPIKLSNGAHLAFNEIEIDYKQRWQVKMLNSIALNYKKTPYFEEYYSLLSVIINKTYPNLAAMNINLIRLICEKLNIQTKLVVASDLGVDFGQKNDMIVNIVKFFQGETYLSGNGARKYNDEVLFNKNGISLQYSTFHCPGYTQLWGDFIPNLSVLDALFNVGQNTEQMLLNGHFI